jgi:hypothetical protein
LICVKGTYARRDFSLSRAGAAETAFGAPFKANAVGEIAELMLAHSCEASPPSSTKALIIQ